MQGNLEIIVLICNLKFRSVELSLSTNFLGQTFYEWKFLLTLKVELSWVVDAVEASSISDSICFTSPLPQPTTIITTNYNLQIHANFKKLKTKTSFLTWIFFRVSVWYTKRNTKTHTNCLNINSFAGALGGSQPAVFLLLLLMPQVSPSIWLRILIWNLSKFGICGNLTT